MTGLIHQRQGHFTRCVQTICAILVFGLVAACSTPQGPNSYRDPSKVIAATTRFDVERFWGNWHVRQAYIEDSALRTVALLPDRRGGLVWQTQRERCEGTVCALDQTQVAIRETGTGRMVTNGTELWVLWVDTDFRTAAIGTPDGRFGYILDRRKNGGADRIAAAREVMDFNGYDISQLQVIQ